MKYLSVKNNGKFVKIMGVLFLPRFSLFIKLKKISGLFKNSLKLSFCTPPHLAFYHIKYICKDLNGTKSIFFDINVIYNEQCINYNVVADVLRFLGGGCLL